MATPYIKRTSDNKTADFVWLTPINPSTFQPVIQPIDRPNVDGFAFRKFAKKGEPFAVRAFRDFSSVASARAAVQHLRDGLIGELCDIVTRDVTTYGRMMCLKVNELEIREAINCVGGLSATSTGSIFGGSGGATTARVGLATVELIFIHASAPSS